MGCDNCFLKDSFNLDDCNCLLSLKIDYTYCLDDDNLECKYLNYDLTTYISRLFNVCESVNSYLENLNLVTTNMFVYKNIVELLYGSKSYLIIDDLLNNTDLNLFNKYVFFMLKDVS